MSWKYGNIVKNISKFIGFDEIFMLPDLKYFDVTWKNANTLKILNCEADKSEHHISLENVTDISKEEKVNDFVSGLFIKNCNLNKNNTNSLKDILLASQKVDEIFFQPSNHNKIQDFQRFMKVLAIKDGYSKFTFQNCILNDDLMNLLIGLIEKNKIERFVLRNVYFENSEKFNDLCLKLRLSEKHLNILHFIGCNLNSSMTSSVGKLLKNTRTIKNFQIQNNNDFMKNGFDDLCSGLSVNKTNLKVLNLSNNRLNYEQGLKLSDFLMKNHLESLNLNFNYKMMTSIQEILKNLSNYSPSLRILSLSYCNLGPKQGEYILNILNDKEKLQNLKAIEITGNERLGPYKELISRHKTIEQRLIPVNSPKYRFPEHVISKIY